jgi:hypothetical protein
MHLYETSESNKEVLKKKSDCTIQFGYQKFNGFPIETQLLYDFLNFTITR